MPKKDNKSIKYILIDDSLAEYTRVGKFSDAEKMLDAIQDKALDEIEVWEVIHRVNFTKRPAIVVEDKTDRKGGK